MNMTIPVETSSTQTYNQHIKSYRLTRDKQRTLQELSRLASELTHSPIALVSIKEDNDLWYKAQHGGARIEKNKQLKPLFFKNIESESDFYQISDLSTVLSKEERKVGKKKNLFFYAGITLISSKNIPIGTISVFDFEPRTLTIKETSSLRIIAALIVKQLLLRKRNLELSETTKLLKENNEMLTQFAHVVSHDMKMPLASMILTVDVLRKKFKDGVTEENNKYLDFIKESAFNLSNYVENILSHYESDNLVKDEKNVSDVYTLCENVGEILAMPDDVLYTLPPENLVITCNTAALSQILLNLVGNSLKYNDKDQIKIKIKASEDDQYYYFEVKDNGVGIPKKNKKDIFKLFTTLDTVDRYGKSGNGIGLSTVHKLVTKIGGTISVKSKEGEGTNFKFSILK
jgi:K+-sensing histidine kinase KdpD